MGGAEPKGRSEMIIDGKTVLVTGASRGIGQALVEEALSSRGPTTWFSPLRTAGRN